MYASTVCMRSARTLERCDSVRSVAGQCDVPTADETRRELQADAGGTRRGEERGTSSVRRCVVSFEVATAGCRC